MQALEEKLQYHFKNLALLEEALRHSSYANEHAWNSWVTACSAL